MPIGLLRPVGEKLGLQLSWLERTPDKGEVGGSNPPRPTNFFVLKLGLQLSWESACLARRRSAVRSRLAPPFTVSKKLAINSLVTVYHWLFLCPLLFKKMVVKYCKFFQGQYVLFICICPARNCYLNTMKIVCRNNEKSCTLVLYGQASKRIR